MWRNALGLVGCAALVAGCGGGTDAPAPRPRPAVREHAPRVKPLHCPRSAGNCRAATGRILYVEAVDPDGDGDAHFVLASGESVTGPGITAVDVERALRPHPLPRIGDAVAAAGPVYRGSYGQRQIQAVELRIARARHRAP